MNLKDKLNNGKFVNIFEILPKKDFLSMVPEIKKNCFFDAVSISDNPRGIVYISSLAASFLLEKDGIETLMHVSCANKNRIEIKSQVLGALSSGIHNVFFVSGDHNILGNNPEARMVYDIDSTYAISYAREISSEIFIGGAANPLADPLELQVMVVERKISSGGDFIITQPVYEIDYLKNFIKSVKTIKKPFHIIAGLMPLSSEKKANFINTWIPGLYVPNNVINRIRNGSDQRKEGIEIAREIYHEIRKIKEISGVDFMSTDIDTVMKIVQ